MYCRCATTLSLVLLSTHFEVNLLTILPFGRLLGPSEAPLRFGSAPPSAIGPGGQGEGYVVGRGPFTPTLPGWAENGVDIEAGWGGGV